MSISRRKFVRKVASSAFSGMVVPSSAALIPFDTALSPRSSGLLSGLSQPIRLHRNENAYGTSEKSLAAIRMSTTQTNRYPDGERELLRETIAKHHGVRSEQIVIGAGSSEILRAAAVLFGGSGKKLIVASPTFDVTAREARWLGTEVDEVPLKREYAHDLEKMLSRAGGSEGGLIYVSNPNNPTGTLTPRRDLESFLKEVPASFNVLIDEAYHEYLQRTTLYDSFIDNPSNNKRVMVTRTFSKMYGLAGARVGYGVASPETARMFAGTDLESGVNIFGAEAALAALADQEFVRRCYKRNVDDRQEFLNQVNGRHGHVVDPQANFVFIHAGRPAKEVVEHFEKNGILIGPPFSAMNTHVRVSLGTAPEMQEFWRVWDLLIPAGSMTM